MTDYHRRDSDEVLGYLRATVENSAKRIEELADRFSALDEKMDQRDEEIKEQIQGLRDELNIYKVVIKVLKALGWTFLAIITLKLGDITQIWKILK